MNEFIKKLIGRLEENGQKMCEAKSSVPYGKHSPSNHTYYKAISVKKAIHIVNQLAEEYNQNSDQDLMIAESLPSLYPMMQPFEVEAIHRVVERGKYGGGWIEKLLEAKKNCGEDSDCSKCPFGQIEDRCILNELQIESENNGWISVEDRLPEDYDNRFYMCIVENHEEDLPMFCQYDEEYGFGFWRDIYDEHTLGFVDSEFKTNEELGYEKVIAWQPLPTPYQPEGE